MKCFKTPANWLEPPHVVRIAQKLQQGKAWLANQPSLPALLRDQIEQKIWQETLNRSSDFIRELHQDLAFAIIWQNGAFCWQRWLYPGIT